jgi:hypothetical protein
MGMMLVISHVIVAEVFVIMGPQIGKIMAEVQREMRDEGWAGMQ